MSAAGFTTVDNKIRGEAIRRRRSALGIDSVSEFARVTKRIGNRDVKGVSIDAISAAEKGEASENTYLRLESWLDRFEEETGHGAAASSVVPSPAEAELAAPPASGGEGDMVEFHIGAIDVTVKGPVANLSELEAAVEKLIRGTRPRD